MPSYVIVWENNTFGHRAVAGKTWSGHSAINIGDDFQVAGKRGRNNYASWFPAESAGFEVKDMIKAAFSRSQAGRREVYFSEDVKTEGYLPDHVVRIDTTGDQERAMLAEWKSVYLKPSGASYKNFRKNCSTVVSRIIHAAGLHARKWSTDSNFVWSPGDIRALAVGVGGTMLRWKDVLDVLAKSDILPGGLPVDYARSGRLCSTGVTCKYQPGETWKPK